MSQGLGQGPARGATKTSRTSPVRELGIAPSLKPAKESGSTPSGTAVRVLRSSRSGRSELTAGSLAGTPPRQTPG